jgi:hypothetical protein
MHVARAWGRRSIWLRVNARNEGAIQLYLGLGYSIHSFKGFPWQQSRDIIMSKSLETLPLSCPRSSQLGIINIEKERGAGVYVWGPGDTSVKSMTD